ncbi:zona pellucida-like domain-containing protein 1 [Hypomesus transpacificus]|uniref:zona pellucida-like domain-containing protein 1 n=1 Tax=Hypomesus transpacificus TaxID=137520 RepID=UPI001F072A4C|nr:zona pellucida-like domain-containing protein 1 [Hypomesus transpacificus]
MPHLGFFVLAWLVARSCQLDCESSSRRPAYTDISVECGTDYMSLSILICPAIYSGYNESLLILNNMFNDPACKGTISTNVTPPVVKYRFPLNMTNACGSVFMTTSSAGTGVFSDFSNIQTVNISGVVRSYDPTTGTVTYNAELKYYYSCAYPLEYLINNTRIDVSASSIAVKDNNGSFISTLSMALYADSNYTSPLVIPPLGIELRTKVYVQVQATNLTAQYYVLLDRCYASTSPHPTNSTYFNLFVSCSRDQMTNVSENGESQHARFNFPAFRFLEQQNQTVSTYYLHCITRLCEKSTCSTFRQCRKRRRRSVDTGLAENGVTESTTLSTRVPIVTKAESIMAPKIEAQTASNDDSSKGLGVAVGVLTVAVIVVLCMAAVFYRRLKHK